MRTELGLGFFSRQRARQRLESTGRPPVSQALPSTGTLQPRAPPLPTPGHREGSRRQLCPAPVLPAAKPRSFLCFCRGSLGVQRGAGQPSSCFPVGEPFRKAAFFPECQGRPLSEAQSLHGEAGRPRRARGVTQSPKPAGGSHGKDPGLEERGQGHVWVLGDRLLSSEMPPRGSHPRGLPTPGPDTAFNGGVHVTSLL